MSTGSVAVDASDLVGNLRRYCEAAARNSTKIPDEPALAKEFGVSRTKLREALACLEHEGAISRRRRVGIVANLELPSVRSRFDRQVDYLNTLRENGMEPSVSVVSVVLERAEADVAEVFRVDVGTPMLTTTKVWLGDGRPTMTAKDRIPVPGLLDINGIDAAKSVFDLVRELTNSRVVWEMTRPSAAAASTDVARLLRVEVGSPLFTLDTIGVSEQGQRLFDSLEHHLPGAIDFGLARPVVV
jgi:GntR family transcriptional regulator